MLTRVRPVGQFISGNSSSRTISNFRPKTQVYNLQLEKLFIAILHEFLNKESCKNFCQDMYLPESTML